MPLFPNSIASNSSAHLDFAVKDTTESEAEALIMTHETDDRAGPGLERKGCFLARGPVRKVQRA